MVGRPSVVRKVSNPNPPKSQYAGIAQSVEQLIRNQQVACSSHVSSSKKKDTLLACLSFWVSAAEGRLHPSVFQCSGRQSHHCSKVFASGENTCTPQKRRGPEGPLGEQGLMHKISILTVLFSKAPCSTRSFLKPDHHQNSHLFWMGGSAVVAPPKFCIYLFVYAG